jgi:dienelactone hydrolase
MSRGRLNRRGFVKRAAGAGALALAARPGSLPAAQAGPPAPRERQEAMLSAGRLDTLAFSLEKYQQTEQSLAFKARDRQAAEAWQRQLGTKLTELLGGFPSESCPLQARVVETFETPHYRRQTVLFQSRPNLTVYAYFLLPVSPSSSPLPTVVCLPGHGRGVDSICGMDERGNLREWGQWGEYQADFALQCVSQGYAVLAVEPLGFGYRRDAASRARNLGASSCQPASGAALLLGETIPGWRVYDMMRALDYLAERPEADPQRLALMGISGGGTITFLTAALDPRVKAAVVSGYYNTFRDSVVSISHCMDNYVPGLLRYAEMWDIAGLIAPRAFFAESGTRDDIFPIDATKLSFKRAQEIFQVFGASDRLELEVFEGEHQFWGKGAFEFLKKRL